MLDRPPYRRRSFSAALVAVLALAAACGDDSDTPAGPGRAAVAGTYRATTFTTALGTTVTDVLAKGGSVSLTLNQDGTATGSLFVPQIVANSDFNESISGAWSLQGTRVRLTDNSSDTFLEDLTLEAQQGAAGRTLTGGGTFSGITVQLVLTRVD